MRIDGPSVTLPRVRSSRPHAPEAEELFLEFVRGDATSERFEALCRANANHEPELRALKSSWDAIAPKTAPLDERIRERFGASIELGGSIADDHLLSTSKSLPLVEQLRNSGRTGSRYRLLGEVARGGMGVILKIWDDDLRRALAMKVALGTGDAASGSTGAIDAKTLGRFLEEAQITGQLDHPGIVPVHELGLDPEGRVYFTMRLVRGEDLSTIFHHLRDGTDGWNPTRVLSVLLKVCEAMSYAHSKSVIHRDLKPANVMVGKFGEVYVMDWGLARVLGRADRHDLRIHGEASSVTTVRSESRTSDADTTLVTLDGEILGTPNYMPPEQANGQLDALGPHSDVYSVGVMLYQLVTGEMPYSRRGERMSVFAILDAVTAGPPVAVLELAPRTPPELVAIVEKAMARVPSDRYASMQALADDLRAYLEGRVVRAYEAGAWAETRKWVQRNKPLSASIVAVLVVAVVGAVAFAIEAHEATDNANRAEGIAQSERRARAEADRNAEIARRKTADVLSLSAQKDLDDLVARAETLWPARPQLIPEYESWLAQAKDLIEGHAGDDARSIKKRPSLAEHKAKLAELRSAARPLTADRAEADRESNPKYKEFEAKRTELTWHSRMLGLEPWPKESEVDAQLAGEALPREADALNAIAWPLVDPSKPPNGQEVRALLLARRALAVAVPSKRAGVRDTLAWAMFRLGRFDEAIDEETAASKEPGGELLVDSLKTMTKSASSWRAAQLPARRAEHEQLARELADLDRDVGERRTFEYDDPEASWWDHQLSKLVDGLESLADSRHGLMSDAIAEPFGWGVMKRYEFARSIEERSATGAEAKKRWAEAIAAIENSPMYGGLALKPQLGLLPIGPDPHSELWEFAHLQTGEPASRDANGKLALTEETGLVFVLIPGGKFWMGSQRVDPNGRNFDSEADGDESPVHEVELSPFFLSKYEMTQGQWQRFTARNPSNYSPSNWSLSWNREGKGWTSLHPVEQVSWLDCVSVTTRLGLSLPSEAQWEFAARARTSTRFWSGDGVESLEGTANVADTYGKNHGATTWTSWEDAIDDGNTVHAEVGSFAANAFGLHDVHGNVWEWCIDGWDSGFYAHSPKLDPVAPWDGAVNRVNRGGSFDLPASAARSAGRSGGSPDLRSVYLGLRPARRIDP